MRCFSNRKHSPSHLFYSDFTRWEVDYRCTPRPPNCVVWPFHWHGIEALAFAILSLLLVVISVIFLTTGTRSDLFIFFIYNTTYCWIGVKTVQLLMNSKIKNSKTTLSKQRMKKCNMAYSVSQTLIDIF